MNYNFFASDRIDLTEMDKLEEGLIQKGLEYTRRPFYDGEQIICGNWDAVCHGYSYGHEDGLLEIMGDIVECGYDRVEGCMTAEEILERI